MKKKELSRGLRWRSLKANRKEFYFQNPCNWSYDWNVLLLLQYLHLYLITRWIMLTNKIKQKQTKKQKGFMLQAADPLNSLSWTSNNSVVWYLIALNPCFYPVIPSSEHTTFLLSLNNFPSFNALKSPLLTNSLISLLGYSCVINMTPKMKCCFFFLSSSLCECDLTETLDPCWCSCEK